MMNNKCIILLLSFILISSIGYAFSDTTGLHSTHKDILRLEVKKSNQLIYITRVNNNNIPVSDSFSLVTTTGRNQSLSMNDSVNKLFRIYINLLKLVENGDSLLNSKINSLKKNQVVYFTFLPPTKDTIDTEIIQTNTPSNNTSEANNSKFSILPLFLAFLAGALLVFIYFWIKRKSIKAKLNTNESIQKTITILKSGEFNFKSKSSSLEDFAKIATDQYKNLLEEKNKTSYELKLLQSLNNKLEKQNKELITIEKEQKESIQNLEKQYKEQQEMAYENEQIANKQLETAKEFLKNYYYELVTKIEHGHIKGESEKKKFALKKIIQAAFQSFSQYRIVAKEDNESDELNSKILENKPIPVEKSISINTNPGSTDELAYLVMRLLNDYDIQELEGVFIHGYKIGK